MKKRLIILTIIVTIVILGKFGFRYAIHLASDKVVQHVVNELLDEQFIGEIVSNPEIEGLVLELIDSQSSNISTSSIDQLPFTTKEEGVKVILNKFSVGEMTDIAFQVQGGLSSEKQVQLVNQLKERLTEQEIEALMVIGAAELQKELQKQTQ